MRQDKLPCTQAHEEAFSLLISLVSSTAIRYQCITFISGVTISLLHDYHVRLLYTAWSLAPL